MIHVHVHGAFGGDSLIAQGHQFSPESYAALRVACQWLGFSFEGRWKKQRKRKQDLGALEAVWKEVHCV